MREEYKRVLMENEYGQIPPKPEKVYAVKIKSHAHLSSKVIYTEWMLYADMPSGDTIMFPFRTYFIPGSKKTKTLIHLDFFNELPNKYSPTEEIIEDGWNIVHVYYEDIVEDNKYRKLNNDQIFERICPDTGKIMIWAWSMMRVFDVIEKMEEVDEKNVGIVGHSRLGKTAFVTGAFDDRFAFVDVNGSGSSGAAMWSHIILDGKYRGERIEGLYAYNPFWYCKKFSTFAGQERELPWDQHLLGYLVAPRVLNIASGSLDVNASPMAEFEVCKACSNAWDYYGKPGYIGPDTPVVDEGYFEGNVGYCSRYGQHFLGKTEWNNLMKFFNSRLNK